MDIQRVQAGRGIAWIQTGWTRFMRLPGLWVLLMLAFLAIIVVLSMLPWVGSLIVALIGPVLGAGALEGPQKTQATIAPQDAGMLLSWTHFAWNDAYEVHGSTSPYFLPDEWTRLTVVEAPTSEFADTSPGAERYYVIRALEQGLGAESNRTGYFQFDLTTQGVTHG